MSECENCEQDFEPKPPSYTWGFNADTLCEDCCMQEAEEDFYRAEQVRCGG